MRQDSVGQWLRSLLCGAVLAIWVTCLLILGVACWVRDNLNPIIVVAEGTTIGNYYIHSFFPIIFPVLITASCLMLVIGCVGCCGAFSDNKMLLGWFFISNLVSLCVEISAGVGGKWGWNTNSENGDAEYLYEKLESREWQSIEWINQAWKEIQIKFNCCDIHVSRGPTNYYAAVSAICLESATGIQQPCEESLISFLMETKVSNVLPVLAGILGILQFAAMVITVKLWMIACVAERLKESEAVQNLSRDAKPIPIQLKPPLKNISVQTSPSSVAQTHSRSETLWMKPPAFASNNRDYTYNERCCPQCVMKWYDESKLMKLSRLENEYKQQQLRSNGDISKESARYCDQPLPSGSTAIGWRSIPTSPYHTHELRVKSASYNSPTDWKSPSLQFVVKRSRDCYSASLPRRKQKDGSRQRRLNYPHNFVLRLSTIRASGVAADGDSSDSEESTQEELGGSRCYNTEVGSTSSGDKVPFARYERSRKSSEPVGTGDSEISRVYRSVYTTL